MENFSALQAILKLYGISVPIASYEDLSKLPFMSKEDLIQWKLPQCPVFPKFIQESSGTTGEPCLIYADDQGKQMIEERYKEIFITFGLRKEDVFLNLFGYRIGGHGMDVEAGSRMIGSTIIPVTGIAEIDKLHKMDIFNRLQPTAAIMTTDAAFEALSKLDFSTIKKVIVGGQYLHPFFRKRLEKKFGVEVYNGFGMSEFGAMGIEEIPNAGEFKLVSSLIYEVVDENGNASFEGEGELVVTDPYNRSTKLIRYKTGDIVRLRKGYMSFVKRVGDNVNMDGVLYSKTDIGEKTAEMLETSDFLFVIQQDVAKCKDNLFLFLKEEISEEKRKEVVSYLDSLELPPKIIVKEDLNYKSPQSGKHFYFKDMRKVA